MKRWLAAILLTSCGGAPEASRPVGSEFIEVEYPPPPAEIEERDEELPGRPDCRFVHGSYAWQARRWRWIPGQWVVPPKACSYAAPALFWKPGNPARLYYTPAYWYRTDAPLGAGAKAPCEAPVPCLTPSPMSR